MKALILNSGRGSRMGQYTDEHPKCMTDLLDGETIISRQLKMLEKNGFIYCGIIHLATGEERVAYEKIM